MLSENLDTTKYMSNKMLCISFSTDHFKSKCWKFKTNQMASILAYIWSLCREISTHHKKLSSCFLINFLVLSFLFIYMVFFRLANSLIINQTMVSYKLFIK